MSLDHEKLAAILGAAAGSTVFAVAKQLLKRQRALDNCIKFIVEKELTEELVEFVENQK